MNPTFLVQLLVNGLIVGALYGVVAMRKGGQTTFSHATTVPEM